MRKTPVVVILLLILNLQGGCSVLGIISNPSAYERTVSAEYALTKHKEDKILVLVNQPLWLDAKVNLRYYLTKAINKSFIEKAIIQSEQLIDYKTIADFRSQQTDFPLLLPAEAARALGADIVLSIVIVDYDLNNLIETKYYKGNLAAKASLYNAASGKKLWPEPAKSKTVKVGFDFEQKGREQTIARLVDSLASCTTRYFYDCPKQKFRNFDDLSGSKWSNW